MIFERAEISDLVIIQPKLFKDEREYFSESYKDKELNNFLGYNVNFCQENESKSSYGVLRGLHYQVEPYAQAKLVRVIKGTVLDVAVDLRKDSKTYGKHISIVLSDKSKKQLFIPKGFAHGFLVLSKKAIFSYKVDNYYNKISERGIAFNDIDLNINWNLKYSKIKVSEKDKNNPSFKNNEIKS